MIPPTRRAANPPPPPRKNNLPMVFGLAGGGLLLLIVIIALASGGSPTPPPARVEKAKVDAPKPPGVDVTALEAEGKKKCGDGLKVVQRHLKSTSGTAKDVLRFDLEEGMRLLSGGLEAYKKASDLSGKSYSLSEFTRARDDTLKVLCDDLESDGQKRLDEGLSRIKSSEPLMEKRELTDDERKSLRESLQTGKKSIEEGMNLFDRSYQISGHTFDTTRYGQALKMVRAKLLELK